MQARRAFTLLEIVVVLAIVALIIGATSVLWSGMENDRPVRTPFNEIRAMAKRAWMRAQLEQNPWQIRLTPNKFVLEPKRAIREEDLKLQQEVDTALERSSGIESFTLEEGVKMEVRHWGQQKWTTPKPDAWIFEHSGLCEPLSIRFISAYGTLRADFDPLTANVTDYDLEVANP